MIEGKEAKHYKKLKNMMVQCQLCPWYCTLKNRERGKCGVRENREGKLISLVYARPCSVNVDPIEKKPLYHFIPGSKSFSIGTTGCNLFCQYCQNYSTSRAKPEEIPTVKMEPESVVQNAINYGCKSVSYTYNEPTIFYEYVYDTARIARKKKIKNVMVTNGYINEKPLKELYKYIDGANVDLKGFTEEFYKKTCGVRLKPVLESLKLMRKTKTWIEITNLVIPGYNDDMKKIKEMCEWVKKSLGINTPLHFSRFYPCYEMYDVGITPIETLKEAYEIARKVGIKFVYLGNIGSEGGYSDTFCPKCGELLIKRGTYFGVEYNKIKNGRCSKCQEKIPGVWK
ncbi:MAG: AmmeMemoRadiSam system radical SAM enzyme [Candidatus Nanoarchaeia archaeon]